MNELDGSFDLECVGPGPVVPQDPPEEACIVRGSAIPMFAEIAGPTVEMANFGV